MTDIPYKKNPYSGNFILEQLKKFGSDLNRKHEISFWLYFSNKNSAKQAAHRTKKAGLKPKLSPPLKDSSCSKWLYLLFCPHIPDEKLLDGISEFCTQLASNLNGEYDGWESKLEPEEGQNIISLLKNTLKYNNDTF